MNNQQQEEHRQEYLICLRGTQFHLWFRCHKCKHKKLPGPTSIDQLMEYLSQNITVLQLKNELHSK